MRWRTCSGAAATSMPATVAEPAEGSRMPHSIRMVVVFPEPFGPSSPNTSPRSMRSVSSRTAVTGPKRRVRPRVSTPGGLTAAAGRTG